jgi:S1-C subfamily serine protease
VIRKFVPAFLLVLVTVTAFAQQPPGVHPSYVSISMKTDPLDADSITTAICGGVVADEQLRIIATAWHCVPNQKSALNAGTFFMGNMNATLLSFSPESDIALFQVEDLKGLKAPAFKIPTKGQAVVASAYYDNFPVIGQSMSRFVPVMSVRVTLDWEGKVLAIANADRRYGEHFDKVASTEFKWIIVAPDTAPGFSGGPVFDKDNNLIGIVSSGNAGFTTLSSSENVTEMIKKLK